MSSEKLRNAARHGAFAAILASASLGNLASAEELLLYPAAPERPGYEFERMPGARGIISPCAADRPVPKQAEPIIELLRQIVLHVNDGRMNESPEGLTRPFREALSLCSTAVFDEVANAFRYEHDPSEDTVEQYSRYAGAELGRCLAEAIRPGAEEPSENCRVFAVREAQ
jgi:hypothetical protein